jgi:hypothetical protein
MYDPLLEARATARHHQLLREAEHGRLIKTMRGDRPSPRIRVLVTIAGWLIRWGEVLNVCSQPALCTRSWWSPRTPALTGGPGQPQALHAGALYASQPAGRMDADAATPHTLHGAVLRCRQRCNICVSRAEEARSQSPGSAGGGGGDDGART